MDGIELGSDLRCLTSPKGTLAFFARFSDVPSNEAYAITCSHSLAPNATASDSAPKPDMANGCSVHIPGSNLLSEAEAGWLIWASRLRPDNVIRMDCAVVRLKSSPQVNVAGIGAVNDIWRQDSLPNDLFAIFGEATIHGTLVTQDRLAGPLSVPGRTDGPFDYADLFAVTYDAATQPGMSGSGIVTGSGQVVGMHVGGIDKTGFFHRADELLTRLGMTLYRI